ncbi:tyrosine-type recombinase/integrase [Acidobacteriota bacterium]
MGSVFRRKRKDARANWYVEFSYGGKRVRRLAKGAETKTEAKAFLREIERQIDRTEYAPQREKQILFESWAEKYMEWARLNKRSWKRDEIFLGHLIPFFRGVLLQNITPLFVEDYKRKRKAKVSGATVNRELSCLKHMFNMAIDESLIIQNPVRKVRYFPESAPIENILSQAEKDMLVEKSDGYIHAVIVIALNTGMRRGEILGLKWSQVDFDRGYIKVEKSKSGKARAIPMNSEVDSVMRALSSNKVHENFVFWNSKSKAPIQDIRKAFARSRKAAGIHGFRFHDLRHNFATSLVENGVDIVTVSELLGHSNINLTAKRYSHPSPSHKQLAVESLVKSRSQKADEILPELLPVDYADAAN